jgi:hypothetical protein
LVVAQVAQQADLLLAVHTQELVVVQAVMVVALAVVVQAVMRVLVVQDQTSLAMDQQALAVAVEVAVLPHQPLLLALVAV